MNDTPITYAVGQAVRWPPAPGQLAQVEELRRTHVRLYYRRATGRPARPIVPAAHLAEVQQVGQPPLPWPNPFARGCLPRTKRFGSAPPPDMPAEQEGRLND